MKFYIFLTIIIIDLLFTGSLYGFLHQIKQNGSIYLYGLVAAITVFFVFYVLSLNVDTKVRNPLLLKKLYVSISLFILFYFPKIVFIIFFAFNKLVILIQKGFILLSGFFDKLLQPHSFSFITYTGIVLATLLFLSILYGMINGRFNYKVDEVDIAFKKLPEKFDGFRIVQLSDIHLGALSGKEKKIEEAINIINGLNPDVIFFTGDLVNNFSEEALGWAKVFSKLGSGAKKYSILGNHDYGDYWDWDSGKEKEENLQLLFDIQKEMGFKLLKNESDIIAIDGEEIGITGVENWGKPPFHQFGDLKKAMEEAKPLPFRILLSHDPSYWEYEIKDNDSVDLTLSGHTHGMQFGLKIGKFQWSPVKYIYKYWSGLYENNGRYLYVNRGLGHIAYLGRVGMRPEITLITLKKMN